MLSFDFLSEVEEFLRTVKYRERRQAVKGMDQYLLIPKAMGIAYYEKSWL